MDMAYNSPDLFIFSVEILFFKSPDIIFEKIRIFLTLSGAHDLSNHSFIKRCASHTWTWIRILLYSQKKIKLFYFILVNKKQTTLLHGWSGGAFSYSIPKNMDGVGYSLTFQSTPTNLTRWIGVGALIHPILQKITTVT